MKKSAALLVVVMSAGLTVPTTANSAPGQKVCVTQSYLTTGLQVKNAPSHDAETVMVIGAGRVIIEFGRKDGWISGGVDGAGGIDGYVPDEAVSDFDIDGLPCGS